MAPASHAVLGSAPMKTNRARVWIECRSPVRRFSVTTALSAPFPCTSRISVHDRTATRGGGVCWGDEIPGHGFVQVLAADPHIPPGNPRGEEDRRLARGVTTPDDDDRSRAAHQRFLKG